MSKVAVNDFIACIWIQRNIFHSKSRKPEGHFYIGLQDFFRGQLLLCFLKNNQRSTVLDEFNVEK